MKRLIYNKLLAWKENKDRKPLLMQGARQVGKTYILRELGAMEYADLAYFNFEEDPGLIALFSGSLEARTLMESLSLYRGKKIKPEQTLIFFDEIQAAPRAITSLKYFCEESPEYHIVSAGSLLGVSVGKSSGFPVGKVNFMSLYPMNFLEFLMAGGDSLAAEHIAAKKDFTPLPGAVHEKLLRQYKLYLFLGGMPDVVSDYLQNRDSRKSREIQTEILGAYEQDFSKYSTSQEAIRISEIWNSIPIQLTKKNKKFKYKDVSKRGRASMYETAIHWLRKAGLIFLAYNTKVPKLPLKGYFEKTRFKLFLLDTGLLGALLNLSSKSIVTGNTLFSEYNGAFIENFVAAELTSYREYPLAYWTSKSEAEIDFLITSGEGIYPVEVKSGYSGHLKSLRSYEAKYNPSRIYRLSPHNFVESGNFINIPLYCVNLLPG